MKRLKILKEVTEKTFLKSFQVTLRWPLDQLTCCFNMIWARFLKKANICCIMYPNICCGCQDILNKGHNTIIVMIKSYIYILQICHDSKSLKIFLFDAPIKHHFARFNSASEGILCALSLEFDYVCRLRLINIVFRELLIRVIPKYRIFFPWSQIESRDFVLKLHRLLPQRYVRFTFFLQGNSHGQKLALSINDSFNGYTIINVPRNGEIEDFTVPVHIASVPNLPKGCLSIVLIKKISIDEDVVITILIEIFRMNSKCKIYVIILVIVTLRLISCYYNRIAFLDVFLYPLEEVLILRFFMLVVPSFIVIGQLIKSLFSILPNQDL